MNQIIIHVDMDAFFASVEIRDNPALRDKPLIIGALPHERGVVATCSYEARKYGIHSAMNIKDAYRLCPHGVFMHGSYEKYKAVSKQLHQIWDSYASAAEAIALDEAYLDVTEQAGDWEGARKIAHEIKRRTREELGLTCSVGLAYSKTAAKTASEEKKPDGYFAIPTKEDFVNLIIDRDVRVLYTVGEKTEQKLKASNINTVKDIQKHQEDVVRLLGKQGQWITQLAMGIDDRKVVPYRPEDTKSISREVTFQQDVSDFPFLRDALFLLALSVETRAKRYGLYGQGVTLKITYSDMKSITRSKITQYDVTVIDIFREAAHLLDQVEHRPVRLIGVGIYNVSSEEERQLSFEDVFEELAVEKSKGIQTQLAALQEKYHLDFAGHLDDLRRTETLYKTLEYMRKRA